MATSGNQPKQQQSGLQTFAWVSGIIAGGVVGVDYAVWADVSPTVGGVIGAVISAILTGILLHISADPGDEIKKAFTTVGAFLGIVAGIYVGVSHGEGAGGFFGGAVAGGFLGALAGQIVAGLLSLGALVLLFISRGPVGFFLRKVILGEETDSGVSHLLHHLDRSEETLALLAVAQKLTPF